jgi:hypothetical protein
MYGEALRRMYHEEASLEQKLEYYFNKYKFTQSSNDKTDPGAAFENLFAFLLSHCKLEFTLHKPNTMKDGLDDGSKQTVVIPGEKGEKVFLMLSRGSEPMDCCRGAERSDFRNEAPDKLPGGSVRNHNNREVLPEVVNKGWHLFCPENSQFPAVDMIMEQHEPEGGGNNKEKFQFLLFQTTVTIPNKRGKKVDRELIQTSETKGARGKKKADQAKQEEEEADQAKQEEEDDEEDQVKQEEEAGQSKNKPLDIKTRFNALLRMEDVDKEERGKVGFLYVLPDSTGGSIETLLSKDRTFDTDLIDYFGVYKVPLSLDGLKLLLKRKGKGREG